MAIPRILRSVLPAAVAMATLFAPAAFFSQALAQRGVQSDELPESSQLRRAGSIVKKWVKRPEGGPEQETLFNQFFDDYYFPLMTQATPNGLGELGKLRYDLFRQYLSPAAPAVRQELTAKAYAFATRVIRNRSPKDTPRRYHNAVQYNAVLILGELTSDGSRPLPAANQFLRKVSELATAKRLPAHMQAGSLVALGGHAAKLDLLPPADQTATLAALAKATQPGTVVDSAGPLPQDWLRRRAALGLATGAKKIGNQAATGVLAKLIADETLTLDTRAAIAASLKDLPSSPEASAAASAAVLSLVEQVAKDESTEAVAFEESQIDRSQRDSLSFNKSSRFRFDEENRRVEYVREGLAARLMNLRAGLEATRSSAGDRAEQVDAILQGINGVLTLATSQDSVDLDVTAEIKSMASALSRLNSEQPDPAASAEAAEEAAVEEAVAEDLF